MPYIKQDRRDVLKPLLDQLGDMLENPGEINYSVHILAKGYIKKKGKSYQIVNDIGGAMQNAYLEFYRRIVAPYEDLKIETNGDVWD